ncbi:YjbQ family protein [bacterium]|nr:YjbQ family protein [bacterium]
MFYSDFIQLNTRGDTDIIDITGEVAEHIQASGLAHGLVILFVRGSTGALTTIEYETGVVQDLRKAIERMAPLNIPYAHDARWHDGNGHAHVRAALMGPSLTIPFSDRTLMLGTWQQIVFCDFDNRPRQREIIVQIVGEV